MVLYIYFDNEITDEINMKACYLNPCKNKDKPYLIFFLTSWLI